MITQCFFNNVLLQNPFCSCFWWTSERLRSSTAGLQFRPGRCSKRQVACSFMYALKIAYLPSKSFIALSLLFLFALHDSIFNILHLLPSKGYQICGSRRDITRLLHLVCYSSGLALIFLDRLVGEFSVLDLAYNFKIFPLSSAHTRDVPATSLAAHLRMNFSFSVFVGR